MHDLHVTNNREMNYWLARFVHEVRRQDGKPYPPSTIYWFTAFCASENLSIAGCLTTVIFFQKDDSQFSLHRSELATRMKELIMISIRIRRPTRIVCSG